MWLCVAKSLHSWPFFFYAGGEIYDPETNSWSDMPNGMGEMVNYTVAILPALWIVVNKGV